MIVKEEDISFAFFLKKKKEMMKKNEIFSWFFWIFWIFFYQKLNHKIKWITKSKEETKKRLIIIWKKNENSKWFKFKLFYFALHFSFFFWVHEKILFSFFFQRLCSIIVFAILFFFFLFSFFSSWTNQSFEIFSFFFCIFSSFVSSIIKKIQKINELLQKIWKVLFLKEKIRKKNFYFFQK